jgi:hypothetical protein
MEGARPDLYGAGSQATYGTKPANASAGGF